jgi:hypothetical protein
MICDVVLLTHVLRLTPSPFPPPLNVVYCGTMVGFAQLNFIVNIDRWGKSRARTETMYGVDVFLCRRELCPNENYSTIVGCYVMKWRHLVRLSSNRSQLISTN